MATPSRPAGTRDPVYATYFRYLDTARRFPWSLYHRPINAEVDAFLAALPAGASVLNIGCGLFLNLPELRADLRFTGVDLDPRAVDYCRQHYSSAGASFATTSASTLPFADGSFDAIYATEVIEHCDLPEQWLGEILRVLRPGARALLTTPNYGSVSLSLIERTVLEAIARLNGFSRRTIHPFRCTAPALEALVRSVGAIDVRSTTVAFGWVIVTRFRSSMATPTPR